MWLKTRSFSGQSSTWHKVIITIKTYLYVGLTILIVFLVYISGSFGLWVLKSCCRLVLIGVKCSSTCWFACLARTGQPTCSAAWLCLSCSIYERMVPYSSTCSSGYTMLVGRNFFMELICCISMKIIWHTVWSEHCTIVNMFKFYQYW